MVGVRHSAAEVAVEKYVGPHGKNTVRRAHTFVYRFPGNQANPRSSSPRNQGRDGDLQAVAETAAKLKRWEFMVTASPIVVGGGTGSPLNPIATF